MTDKQVHTAATIAQRLTVANVHAQYAIAALKEVKHAEYEGMLSDVQQAVIYDAIAVLENVVRRTGVRNAIEHFNSSNQ